MAKNWIQGAIKHPGAFTAKAKRAGEGVQEYADQVLSAKAHVSSQTKHQAALAKTLAKMHRK